MAGKRPEAGEKAPGFAGVKVAGGGYAEGATLSPADLTGETVVLYFYPKDDTPGCTKQACGLRDAWGEVSRRAKVFGVSVDPVARHEKFIAKYDLPFPLIADEDHQLVEAYGVWVEKNLYGKRTLGTERTTFVIGGDGVIVAVFPKVKPADHVDRLLEVLPE